MSTLSSSICDGRSRARKKMKRRLSGNDDGGGGSRREVQAAVARRRASHFARFHGDAADDDGDGGGDNLHAGAKNARASELGMWATARDLEKHKQDALERRLSRGNDLPDAELSPLAAAWKPREKGKARVYGPGRVERVPPLFDMCCRFLCDNLEHVASFDGLPDPVRVKLAHWLSRRRLLTPEFLPLVTEGSPTDVQLGDCSLLPEADLKEPLANALAPNSPLGSLHLGQCGRGVSDDLLKALFSPCAEGPRAGKLTSLKMHGAYRAGDNGVLCAIENTPALEELELSHMPRLTSRVLDTIVSTPLACRDTLRSISLKGSEHVSDLAASHLAALHNLQCLDVSGLYNITDAFFESLLGSSGASAPYPRLVEIRAAACPNLTDSTLKRLRVACGATLATLDFSECTHITDAGLLALAKRDDAAGSTALQPPPTLATLRIARCRGVKSADVLITFIQNCCKESLVEVSLSSVPAVTDGVVVELAQACATSLRIANLSWCREVTDGALGVLADGCSRLTELSLYGDTQISNFFLQGHRNDVLDIVY